MHSIVILITVISSFGLCAMDDQGDRKSLSAATADHTVRNPGTLSACMTVKDKLAKNLGIDKNLVRALCIMKALPADMQETVWENVKSWRLVSTMPHEGRCRGVQSLPHGKIAIPGDNKNIKIYDSATGTCIRTLNGSNKDCSIAALDDKTLVSSTENGLIKIWDLESATVRANFNGSPDFVGYRCENKIGAMQLIDHGKLVIGYRDGVVRLWDFQTKQCLQTILPDDIRSHFPSSVTDIQYSNNKLLVQNIEGVIKIFDAQNGLFSQTLKVQRENSGFNRRVQLMPDGKKFVTHTYGDIDVWNIPSGKCTKIRKAHAKKIGSFAVLPDGTLAAASDDKIVKIMEFRKKCLHRIFSC